MSRTKTSVCLETEEFYVSPMLEHDLLEVVEIEEAAGLSRWGFDAYHAELTQGRGALMLVARCHRREEASASKMSIGGFIAARLAVDELHINNVAVRDHYRRCGMGGALLDAVLKKGARLGAGTALLEVRATNYPAQALYEKYGFRVTGRRHNYYAAPLEDALVMSAVL